MKSIMDICYSQEADQYLDLHLPECDRFPVFLYFHGGGIEKGDKAAQRNDAFIKHLTDKGIAVASANYRMYPTAKYPEFIEDAAAATAWVFANVKTYGEVTGIYVGGSSAGGYLSQMLCFDKHYLAKHGIAPMDITGFIHDAGQPTAHFNVLRERGIDSRRVIIDESAPLYYVGADEQYPPMLVIVSDKDIKNRYEQTMLLMSTLKHFGLDENVKLQLMRSSHCAYVGKVDENGTSIFGKLVSDFIESIDPIVGCK